MGDGGGKQVLPSVTQNGEPYVLFSLGRVLIDGLLVFFYCFCLFVCFSSGITPQIPILIFDWREGKAFKTNVCVVEYCLDKNCHLRFNKT